MHMEFSDSPQDCLARAMEEHQTERSDLLRKCDDDPEKESAAVQHADGCFDCNICLIFVSEPVVTLCGHLYCWLCIYKWMQVESMAARQCPVCKAPLSRNTLVPLYGRGCPDSNEEENPEIPGRSSLPHHAMIASVLTSRSSRVMNQDRYGDHPIHEPTQRLPHRRHGDYYSTGYVPASPTFRYRAGGMLGGLVAVALLPWTSTRNHEANMVHASPSTRQRQVESCLHQIWLFLFCCVVLCFFFL